jgi:LPPG:FO 2-phospho-L-lactate transferase
MGTVVALVGQVGGAKLAEGLYRLRGHKLTIVVNTGDDYEHLGLAFSPDIDTVLYTLAGIASDSAPWEPAGETRALHGMLKLLGAAG